MEYKVGDRIGTEYFVCDMSIQSDRILDYSKNVIEKKVQEKILCQEDIDSLKKGYISFPSLDDPAKITCVPKDIIFRC